MKLTKQIIEAWRTVWRNSYAASQVDAINGVYWQLEAIADAALANVGADNNLLPIAEAMQATGASAVHVVELIRASLGEPAAPAEPMTPSELAKRVKAGEKWSIAPEPGGAELATLSHPVDGLITIWSMRPQPGTPLGIAWERGCRQGWDWGSNPEINEALRAASAPAGPVAWRYDSEVIEEPQLVLRRWAADRMAGTSWKETPLYARAEPLADTKRMDWLERQYVEVRTPLVYGSRKNFVTSPEQLEGDERPNNLRKLVDAALPGDLDA